MNIQTTLLILLGLTLAGCESSPSTQSPVTTGDCNAAAVRGIIGKQASPVLLDQARRDSGAEVARLLRPGDIVTLEYNAQRLTLSTDKDGRITRIGCG